MKGTLNCLSYHAVTDDDLFYRLSNAELLDFMQKNFWVNLGEADRTLFEKCLASERTRQLCRTSLSELIEDSPESRYNRYRNQLTQLVRRCAERLAADAGIGTERIQLVISTTSVAGVCPPVSSIVINHLKLPHSTEAIDLSHMGCSALLWGIELAGRLLRPGAAAIVVGAELTSFMADYRGGTENLLATTVFGDGVAGALVAHPGVGSRCRFRVGRASGSIIASEQGLGCIQYVGGTVAPRIRLQTDIDQVSAQGIRAALEPLVRREFVSPLQKVRYLITNKIPDWGKAVDYYVVHTAGTKVLEAVSASLQATDKQFRHNFTSFARFGNLSSTSFLYSLRSLEESQSGLKAGLRLLFLTYGSGFMTRAAAATI